MSIHMTMLDRGLGFRVDVESAVTDDEVRELTDQFCASDCSRFKYGICTVSDLHMVEVSQEGMKPAMRMLLKVVASCPDLVLAIAGGPPQIDSLHRYQPLFREFPWTIHRCRSADDAMAWITERMTLTYGIVPDYLRTIPIPLADGDA